MKLKKEGAALRVLRDSLGGVFCVSWGMEIVVVGWGDREKEKRKK